MSHPILALFAGLFILAGCRKDLRFTEDGVTLDFSRDTILFDTVFTTLNTSVTKRSTVRNPDANAVKVDIVLVGGPPSPFRINVDGLSGDSFEEPCFNYRRQKKNPLSSVTAGLKAKSPRRAG